MLAFKKEFFWIGFYSLIANALLIAPAIYNLQVYDRVFVYHNEISLLVLTSVLIMFLGFMATAEWLRSRLMVRVGVRFDQMLNAAVFKASFDAYLLKPGYRAVEAFNDLTQVRQFITGQGLFAIFDIPWAPIYISVLFVMHPVLGWTAVVFAVLNTGIALLGQRHSAQRNQLAQDLNSEQMSFLQSKLRNIDVVDSLGMIRALMAKWLGLNDQQMKANALVKHQAHVFQSAMKFLGQIQGSLILAVAALLMIRGELTMGAMVAANMIMGQATRPFSMIASSWQGFLQARHSYRRLRVLLAGAIARGGQHRAECLRGEIELKQVSAYAESRDNAILSELTLRVPPGSSVAIIGPSGAGKSTLLRVMLGIWGKAHGQILIDSVPMEHWERESLGRGIGYLPQDVELFDAKVSENIARMGEVDPDAVVEAAKRAGLHELILRLPQGYDTVLGEFGGVLSGGQRQRVGLARALYGDPNLLMLDEPAANLDDLGQQALGAVLKQLKAASRTVLMVTHDRSHLLNFDWVIALDHGKLVFFGNPHDFMQR